MPVERDIGEPPLSHGEQGREQIGLEPQHQRLRLGIAEAHVVFDQLRRAVLDHQPGIEHALERRAALAHGAHRRRDDLLHDARAEFWRHDRRGRVGAHAAGVGALVAVEGALVVLRRGERQHGLAVGEREEARFLAVEKLLDHELGAGRAERAAKQASMAASASARVSAMTTPLPAASPSALTTIGSVCLAT